MSVGGTPTYLSRQKNAAFSTLPFVSRKLHKLVAVGSESLGLVNFFLITARWKCAQFIQYFIWSYLVGCLCAMVMCCRRLECTSTIRKCDLVAQIEYPAKRKASHSKCSHCPRIKICLSIVRSMMRQLKSSPPLMLPWKSSSYIEKRLYPSRFYTWVQWSSIRSVRICTSSYSSHVTYDM